MENISFMVLDLQFISLLYLLLALSRLMVLITGLLVSNISGSVHAEPSMLYPFLY